jgi:cobalamin biosynthesis protein CbiD
MLVGIYYSAVYVSQDRKLRQAITSSSTISKQLQFLKNIGKSHMASEIQKNVKQSIKKLSSNMEEESGIQTNWEENIQDYIDLVLKEKEKMKRP